MAAAAAAEGMRARRAEDGLGCRVCGATFANRTLVLKHIEKTGHVRAPGSLPDGIFYVPPEQRARTLKGALLIE